MEEKAHHILKEENTVTELTVKRKDQVEVALSGKEFSRRDLRFSQQNGMAATVLL